MKKTILKMGRANTVILLTGLIILIVAILDILIAEVLGHSLTQPRDLIRAGLVTLIIGPFVATYLFDLLLEINKLEKDKQTLATYDELTGLFNRPVFNKACEKGHNYALRNKQGYCILAVEIDNFNGINEKYGIAGGDQLLKVFGQVAQATVRDSDIYARMGGEKFTFFLPNTTIEQATILADRLREHIKHKAVIHDGTKYIKYTVCIGISNNQHKKTISFEKAMKMAGDALQVAQEKSVDTVAVYTR